MKRKKLVESPKDLCICGHERKFHKENSWCSVELPEEKQTEWSTACMHGKFFDRRHCKIKSTDPILKYLLLHKGSWVDYDRINSFTGSSMPTISRRRELFEWLNLVDVRLYPYNGVVGSYTHQRLNHDVYNKLVEEKIIV